MAGQSGFALDAVSDLYQRLRLRSSDLPPEIDSLMLEPRLDVRKDIYVKGLILLNIKSESRFLNALTSARVLSCLEP